MGFDPLLKRMGDDTMLIKHPPIFLIGAPRSGSTAFIQLLYQSLYLSYISNIMALLPSTMVRQTQIYPRGATAYQGKIQPSSFGYIPGVFSPNEAGKIMRFWFDQDKIKIGAVRRTVSALTSATGSPFFFKNQTNTARLSSIQAVLPEARFLFLKRDVLFTAQSILLTRRVLYGNDNIWWSVGPPGYEAVLDKSPYYQVVWQVIRLEQIAEETCAKQPSQAITISYEDFCENPSMIVEQVRVKFGLQSRDTLLTTNTVQSSNSIRLEKKEWSALQLAFEDVIADLNYQPNRS
jgi:hypothetical protein